MKTTVTEQGNIKLEEVYNPIILTTKEGEEISICMRDSGFEFIYEGESYFAKSGVVARYVPGGGNYTPDKK